jgi:homoserine kinase
MIVRAPATSANIGPGFDCAAVALELWNELEVTDGAGVVIDGEGVGELPADASNLAVRAYRLLADAGGKHFRFTNRIPLERGLGSSAAAIALGLAAAAPAAPLEQLLAAGLTLESHSDNLAAALLGGLVITWDGRATRIAETLPLDAVAVIPHERTSTAASRDTLPGAVAHADAAATAGRAALLGAGAASGDATLFAAALWDRLHEPYRPSSELEAIRADLPPGCEGATLSGSGPTVIAWASAAGACAAALRGRFPAHDVIELAVARRGAL